LFLQAINVYTLFDKRILEIGQNIFNEKIQPLICISLLFLAGI